MADAEAVRVAPEDLPADLLDAVYPVALDHGIPWHDDAVRLIAAAAITHDRAALEDRLGDEGLEIIPVVELAELRAEAARALVLFDEVFRLRAGESDEPAAEGARLTPAELIHAWNAAPAEKRLRWAAKILDSSDRVSRCFAEDHAGALEQVREMGPILGRLLELIGAYGRTLAKQMDPLFVDVFTRVRGQLLEVLNGPEAETLLERTEGVGLGELLERHEAQMSAQAGHARWLRDQVESLQRRAEQAEAEVAMHRVNAKLRASGSPS